MTNRCIYGRKRRFKNSNSNSEKDNQLEYNSNFKSSTDNLKFNILNRIRQSISTKKIQENDKYEYLNESKINSISEELK